MRNKWYILCVQGNMVQASATKPNSKMEARNDGGPRVGRPQVSAESRWNSVGCLQGVGAETPEPLHVAPRETVRRAVVSEDETISPFRVVRVARGTTRGHRVSSVWHVRYSLRAIRVVLSWSTWHGRYEQCALRASGPCVSRRQLRTVFPRRCSMDGTSGSHCDRSGPCVPAVGYERNERYSPRASRTVCPRQRGTGGARGTLRASRTVCPGQRVTGGTIGVVG